MTRIKTVFDKKPAYLGFLTAGDGGYDHSKKALLALIAGGVDIVEIGVPFSDPVADGSTIQQASQRAIAQGTDLTQVLRLIRDIRQKTTTPIILFSYYNPLLAYGESIYAELATAGADGILVVDLPLEEAGSHLEACREHNLDPIFLISPSTRSERLKQINTYGRGMLYYVCRNGTTGVKASLPTDFKEKLLEIKRYCDLPVVAGFGIANREMATQVMEYADGFVVGSRFVDAAYRTQDYAALTALARSIDPR